MVMVIPANRITAMVISTNSVIAMVIPAKRIKASHDYETMAIPANLSAPTVTTTYISPCTSDQSSSAHIADIIFQPTVQYIPI